MKKLLVSLVVLCVGTFSAQAAVTSCGAGYYMVSRANIDGIKAAECQKLWCRDLETGKYMGSGNTAASGYRDTGYPVQLCDAKNNCIDCFGDRKWCSGEGNGEWDPEYGAYTRVGGSVHFESYQKGGCFAWRLDKPNCASGYTAHMIDGQWVCTTSTSAGAAATLNKSSSVRRTGASAVRRRF